MTGANDSHDDIDCPDVTDLHQRLLDGIDDSISPQEATDLLREIRGIVVEKDTWEIAPILEHESYLVVGSYDDGRGHKDRLEKVVGVLEGGENDEGDENDVGNYAFLLEDIELENDAPELAYFKFRLVADYTDHIVGVFEREYGGESHEIATMTDAYLDKSHVFKRELDETGDEIEYGWMTEGFFHVFEVADRLYVWEKEDELLGRVDDVFGED